MQLYEDIEYIVQDGGSTDGTCAILADAAHAELIWESIVDNGQADALNRGFGKSRGEIMA